MRNLFAFRQWILWEWIKNIQPLKNRAYSSHLPIRSLP